MVTAVLGEPRLRLRSGALSLCHVVLGTSDSVEIADDAQGLSARIRLRSCHRRSWMISLKSD